MKSRPTSREVQKAMSKEKVKEFLDWVRSQTDISGEIAATDIHAWFLKERITK